MSIKKAQGHIKRFLLWVIGNTAWDIFRRAVSTIISVILTWYYSGQPQFLGWLAKMNISTIIAILTMLVGSFVIAFMAISSSHYVIKRIFKRTELKKDSDGFVLEKDSDGAYLSETTQRDKNMGSMRTWLVFHNGIHPLKGCRIVLENLGYMSGKTWSEAYTSVERKALRWRVGYDTHDGRIDIASKEKVTLDFARSTRYPTPKMELAYLDGYGGEFLLEGKYKAFLLIDANDLVPIRYEVDFEYRTIGYLEIKEIIRIGYAT